MDHNERPVTLLDVAREAGVAVSTASRALSNPERVSESTRHRVQDVARALAYRPNRMAQSLLSGRTQMLALLVADITNPHNFGLIRGIEAQGRAAGYTLIIGDTHEDPDLEREHVERLSSAVDGFVLGSSRMTDADLADLTRLRPIALYNRVTEGFPSVVTDSVDGGRQVIDHLAALGHRSVAYLAGPASSWADGERRRGLTEAGERACVTVTCCGPFSPTREQGSAAADVGLATGASALVAFNDLLAIGVLQRLERRGVAVPHQVSVVGFDDIFGSDFCRPALTTVAGPAQEAGRTLVDVLLGHRRTGPVVMPTHLMVRDSTAPPPP